MNWLFEKDLQYVKINNRVYLMYIVIAVALGAGEKMRGFAPAYLGMLFSMTCITTCAYDEQDKGYSYLMSLPVTRKMYVMEKYLFNLFTVVVAVVLGAAAMAASGLIRGSMPDRDEIMETVFASLTVALFVPALSMPVILRYGSEKGRMITIVVIGVFLGGFVVGAYELAKSELGKILMAEDSLFPFSLIMPVGAVAIYCLSYFVALRFFRKREF